VRLTDTAAGTVVALDVEDGAFVDVVLLDNVHGLDVDDLVATASLIV
jgi:hypothetical protein